MGRFPVIVSAPDAVGRTPAWAFPRPDARRLPPETEWMELNPEGV